MCHMLGFVNKKYIYFFTIFLNHFFKTGLEKLGPITFSRGRGMHRFRPPALTGLNMVLFVVNKTMSNIKKQHNYEK